MRFVRVVVVIVAVVGLAIQLAFAKGGSMSLNVAPGYLVWREGFDYNTDIRMNMSLENVEFKGRLKDKPVEGTQARAFGFRGAMTYHTELEIPERRNGCAKRAHQQCDISKMSCSEPKIKIDANTWQKLRSLFVSGIPKELQNDYELMRYQESGKIIIKPKTGSGNNVLEKLTPDFAHITDAAHQHVPAFKDKEYKLSWTSPDSFKKAALTVTPGDTNTTISKDVADLIARESRFLYTNILQAKQREDGEIWMVYAEDLSAMIHTSVDGKFRGKVLVRAYRLEDARPVGVGAKIATGWRLEFIQKGYVNGREYRSDIEFVCKDNSGKEQRVVLEPVGERFTGELWLDNEHQMIRYGCLKCKNASYSGRMPKVANLNLENLEMNAKINFVLEYHQGNSARTMGKDGW